MRDKALKGMPRVFSGFVEAYRERRRRKKKTEVEDGWWLEHPLM